MSKQENRTEGPELNPYLHSQLTSDKRGKNIKRWERQLLQEMVFRKLYSYVWKNLTGLFFHIIYKNKVKIDSIPKYKIWNHKTPARKQGSKLLLLVLVMTFLVSDTKGKAQKQKWTSGITLNLKASAQQRKPSRKMIRQSTEWQKYLQIIYLIRV